MSQYRESILQVLATLMWTKAKSVLNLGYAEFKNISKGILENNLNF